jgi:ATP-dependent exoDNAse (exonuclease V) beta subunit
MTRPPEATGRWLETETDPPRPGSFSMVGDFQQSIYHDRADLTHYQRVHDALVAAEAGEAVTFSVTFRLDQRQLDFVNATFGEILNGEAGQVKFVELQPRPHTLPGQVIRLSLSAALRNGQEKLKDRQVARIEAEELARWLKEHGPEKLRARSWREVAILCPRRDWLRTTGIALRKIGLPVEVQSESDLQADSPAYAWLTALCTIMVEAQNHYEIVGVLREVYGLSDHDLAVFSEGRGERFQLETPRAAVGIVSSQIGELAEIRSAIQELPLFAAVEQLITRTALRARLASLPPEDFKDPLADLDTLVTLAAESAASGSTLADFAERLRSEMELQRPARLSDKDAIHLITAQKAKGSEWDAVIVPFLSRRITGFSPRYPSIIRVPGKDEVIAALHKEDREEEIREATKILRRQEMERLLYVAVTRARHTLVLALDRHLFSPVHDRLAVESQLKYLRGDKGETSAVALDALPTNAQSCSATLRAAAKTNDAPEAPAFALTPFEPAALGAARARASDFIRKQNPSDYEESPELPVESVDRRTARPTHSLADNAATLYGSWWHTLFQHFPWTSGRAQWRTAFRALQPSSPDPDRSAREWELFTNVSPTSVLTKFLARPAVLPHTEFPFLWRMNERSSLEGMIDLLLIDPAAGRALLIDWKTNRIKPGEEERLRQQYKPQIAAYWKSVREITKLEVEAGIFATATGQFVAYNAGELEAEWTRLQSLPPEELAEEVAP